MCSYESNMTFYQEQFSFPLPLLRFWCLLKAPIIHAICQLSHIETHSFGSHFTLPRVGVHTTCIRSMTLLPVSLQTSSCQKQQLSRSVPETWGRTEEMRMQREKHAARRQQQFCPAGCHSTLGCTSAISFHQFTLTETPKRLMVICMIQSLYGKISGLYGLKSIPHSACLTLNETKGHSLRRT